MAKWDALKDAVAEVVRQNGSGAITGTNLQGILLSIINSLGENMNFAGIATPETNPGSLSDGGVFYIALTPGTYSNFGGEILTDENLPGLFIYDPDNGGMSYTSLNAATKAELKSISVDIGIFNSIKALTDKLNALPGTFPDILYGRFHGILQDASLGTAVPFKLYQSKVFNGSYAFQTLSIGVSQGTLLGTETSYTEQKNFYRRARRSSGAWVWDAWQSADTATQFDLQALRDRVTALETDEHNEVKQFIFTTKQLLYRRIDIVLPNWIANEGFAAWVHTRRQHYLLSSASALFSPTDGQLYEIGTAYNDLPVGTTGGDIHIKMVISGKNNLVRLYIAVEPYNYVQIETAAQVTFVGSSAEEFNSIVPTTTCRSLDIANLLSTLQEQGTNILSLQQSTFTGVNRPEGYTLTWHTKSGGDRSATIPAYGEAGTTNVDGLKGLGQNVALIDQWFIQDLLAEIQNAGGDGADLGNYVTKTELEEKGYITDKPGKTLHAQNIIPDIDSLEPDAEYSNYTLGAPRRGRWLRAYILEVLADYIEAQNIGSKDKSKTVKILGEDVVIDADGWIQCLQALRFGVTYDSGNEPEFGIDTGGDAALNSLKLKAALPITAGGTGAGNVAAARSNLGLGSAATFGTTSEVSKGNASLVTSHAVYTTLQNNVVSGGKINLSSATSTEIASIMSSLGNNGIKFYIVTDSSGNIPSLSGETSITVSGTAKLLLFGKSSPFGVNVGDILAVTKLTCKIIPLNDAKAASGDFPGADGLETVWDKTQINKIAGIESTANAALPRANQLPSSGTGNMNDALETGVYVWCTLGRPAGATGAFTCVVHRSSTPDYNNFYSIEQTAYGREAELGQVYKRVIFWRSDEQQYGEWVRVDNNFNFDKPITSTVADGTAPFVVASKTKVANLNADLLDGYHENSFFRYRGSANAENVNSYELEGIGVFSIGDVDVSKTDYPTNNGHLLNFVANSGLFQIISTYDGNQVWVRNRWYNNPVPTWKKIAFTHSNITGNAATATKLSTPVTLWGQSFDGSGNVSGALSEVTSINGKNIEELGAGTLSLYSNYADDCLASGIYYDAYTDDYGNGKLLVVATAANNDGLKAVEQTFYAEGGAIFKRILLINAVGAILESMEWRSIAG